jgi:hypothetical protein
MSQLRGEHRPASVVLDFKSHLDLVRRHRQFQPNNHTLIFKSYQLQSR